MRKILREVNARLAKPFNWGTNDCFTLFVRTVELLCGPNHKIPVESSQILGYNGPIEGYRRLKNLGYSSVYDFARKHSVSIPRHSTRDYDFALVHLPDHVDSRIVSPMILIGRHIYGIDETGRVIGDASEALEFIRPCPVS